MTKNQIVYMCEFGMSANILIGLAFLIATPIAYFTGNIELSKFFFFVEGIFQLLFGTWGGLKLSHMDLTKRDGKIQEWYSHFNLGVNLIIASTLLVFSGIAYLAGVTAVAKMLWGFSAALYLVFGAWGGLRLNGLKYGA